MWARFALLFVFFGTSLQAQATAHFEVEIPPVAYIQWLENRHDQMGFEQTMDFADFPVYQNIYIEDAAVETIYLGVLCNSMDGYQVQIEAGDAVDFETVEAMASNGQAVRYRMRLSQSSGSRGSSVSLDLTGFSPSITRSFTTPSELPLNNATAHRYKLEAFLQKRNKQPYSEFIDFYIGRVRATVYLQ